MSIEETRARKRYLGDGVYVSFDGYSVRLTTENGVEATNTIVLEPEVVAELDRWLKETYLQEAQRLHVDFHARTEV